MILTLEYNQIQMYEGILLKVILIDRQLGVNAIYCCKKLTKNVLFFRLFNSTLVK